MENIDAFFQINLQRSHNYQYLLIGNKSCTSPYHFEKLCRFTETHCSFVREGPCKIQRPSRAL